MKKLIVSILSICLMLSASAVLATPVALYDTVTFLDSGPTGGGEFLIYNNNQDVFFKTFCLERNEYVSIDGTYQVVGISDAAVMGGIGGAVNGADPLSGKTAWLFYNFTMGTLPGYDGSDGMQAVLQDAIWMLEEEKTASLNNYYYKMATTGYVSEGVSVEVWADNYIGPVRVLNLAAMSQMSQKGAAQDQLIVTPEPLSLLLLGLGLMGLAGVRRQIK